jgi:hypothetical protein
MKTSEEFLREKLVSFKANGANNIGDRPDWQTIALWFKEFTKLHCEAQLKAILENACMKEYNQGDWDTCWISNDMGDAYVLDKNSIINAYNLNQIK